MVLMVHESTGEKCARVVDNKGLMGPEMDWLAMDLSKELNHGGTGEVLMYTLSSRVTGSLA